MRRSDLLACAESIALSAKRGEGERNEDTNPSRAVFMYREGNGEDSERWEAKQQWEAFVGTSAYQEVGVGMC